MAILCVHGAVDLSAHVLALAALFGADWILNDTTRKKARTPFPTRRTLLLTRRTPAEILRWREETLPEGAALSAEAIIFIRASTARTLLQDAEKEVA